MFLILSPNILEDSTVYSSSHSKLSYLELYIIPLFFPDVILVLGNHQGVFSDICSYEKHLNPMFSMYFKALIHALGIWYYYVCLLVTLQSHRSIM